MAVNRYIIQLVVDTGDGTAKVKGVSKAFEDLENSSNRAGAAVNRFNKSTRNTAGSAGIAGAAAAEFGRLISDMPYGLQAVTNNMSQLGSMFALLVSSAGGTRKALNAMLITMMGPAGILIAFQAAIAALEYFSRSFGKAEKAIDNMAKAQGGAAAELKAFRDGLELQMYSLDDATQMVQKLNDKYDGLNLQLGTNLQLTNDSADALNRLIKASEGAARAKAGLTMVEKLYQQQIEQEIFLEKLRTDGFEGFTAVWEGFKTGLAGGIVMPELGKTLRINAAEAALRNTGESIREILGMVGEEGLGEKLFGSEKEGKDAKKAFFPFLSDDDLQEIEDNLKKIQELRKEAEQDVIDERFSLEEDLIKQQIDKIKESGLLQVEESIKLQRQLYNLSLRRLEEEKKRELENITDPETIKLINDKYAILAEKASMTFRKGLEGALEKPLTVKVRTAVVGKDLLDGGQSESQKAAEEALTGIGKSAVEGFEAWAESTDAARNTDPDSDWFLKATGMTPETFEERAEMVQKGLNATFDLLDAQMQREMAMEEAKTIGINDQLRARLRNEKLTAQERDKINQEISKNEALLVEKQNKIEEKRFKLNKAQGIANAVINTAVGVSKVLPNIPLAAFIGALGAAQIATIASQKFVPTPSPTPNLSAQGGPAESQGPAFNVIGGTITSQLAQAVASSNSQPIKTYVVANEVSTAQALERSKIKEATI
jgi:hypothetical protein